MFYLNSSHVHETKRWTHCHFVRSVNFTPLLSSLFEKNIVSVYRNNRLLESDILPSTITSLIHNYGLVRYNEMWYHLK